MSNTLRSTLATSRMARPEEYLFAQMRFNSLTAESDSMATTVTSGSTKAFGYKVPTGFRATITRVNISIVDTSVRPLLFGGRASLDTGVLVEAWSSGNTVLFDFLDGEPIKMNSGWARLAGSDIVIEDAAGVDHLPVRWTLNKAGRPLLLVSGQKLVFTIQDDLSALDIFTATVQGTVYSD